VVLNLGRAKDILVKPIVAKDARRLVKQWHYSDKVVNNSQVHLGAFLDGKCGGVMQFGPSLDKRKLLGLVSGTLWNEFIELNRLAFADWMPRNGESRCLGVAFRLLRKQYPHIKWVVSFADATQCGDGTIYRASGFVLTGINENKSILEMPDGFRFALPTVCAQGPKGGERVKQRIKDTVLKKGKYILDDGGAGIKKWLDAGAEYIDGFQLRYIYFLHPAERANLTVPELPYSAIADAGADMYKGVKRAPGRGTLANEGRRCEPDPHAPSGRRESDDIEAAGSAFPGE